MKTIRYLKIAVLLLGVTIYADGQIRRTVYGNKHVVSEERKTGTFSGIRVSSGVDVFLKQGDNKMVTVEADENLHEFINTDVRNDVLHIYTNANIRDAKMKRVHISMKEINLVTTVSAGDVIGETPIRSDILKLSASSAGDIKLEVYAKEINADISSSGDITLSGEVDILKANLSSAGDLNAFELKVREADVSVSSAGDADIYVYERLKAKASSAGDINYKGDPEYLETRSSSAGSIRRR